MHTLTIDHAAIKSTLLVAAKQDVRYYLVGACLDVRATDTTLVATNGHMLVAIPLPTDHDVPVGQYIIPADLLKAAKPVNSRTPVVISIDGMDVTIQGAVTVTGVLIDGKFPDWRKIMPTESSGVVAQFNPEYTLALEKAFSLMGEKYPTIHHNGNHAALVNSNSVGVLGVVMPRRDDNTLHSLPSWAK